MTNQEFIEQINNWKESIERAGIRLPNGRKIPTQFFHVFLRMSSSNFRKLINGQDSMRKVQPYTAGTIHFINKLDADVFLDEIRETIPVYMAEYPHKNTKG